MGMEQSLMNGVDELDDVWRKVRARLRSEYGEATYNSWLKPLSIAETGKDCITLGVPTRFMRDWIATHYGERIRDFWQAEDPAGRSRVEIAVSNAAQTAKADVPATPKGTGKNPAKDETAQKTRKKTAHRDSPRKSPATAGDGEEDLGAKLDERFTFDSFVVGRPNELAYAAARRVADSDEVSFNPLFLYGGVGLGKTHLMHAIGWYIHSRFPERKVVYMSAEKFMYRFIRAVRYKDTIAFKQQFRAVDVLMIDDVQFIAGKESTQEEFFHTFNALVDQNRQIVISADRSPSDLEGIEERIRSRLGWGLVADIHPSDYELRLGILQSKIENAGVDVPQNVLEFLAHRITSNVRELEGAMNRVLAYHSLVGRPITLETTQEVLQDLLRANDRHITIEEIQKKVAEHYNIRLSDMYSARRARSVARPRQIAMSLAKQLTSRSLPEIGRKFGGRDHTTVMHAVRKVEQLCETDASFAEDVDLLRRMLQS